MELRGTLSDFSFEVILGLIWKGRKTGTLNLTATTVMGLARQVDISFLDGEITSIRCGTLCGIAALREAAICVEGSFEFSISSTLSPGNDTAPVAMNTALAAINEARHTMTDLKTTLPTDGSVFSHGIPDEDTVHISVEEFRLLAVFHDGMTLGDLVAANPAPAIDSMRIVRQLMERGLLVG